jgi:hypothetical protein
MSNQTHDDKAQVLPYRRLRRAHTGVTARSHIR